MNLNFFPKPRKGSSKRTSPVSYLKQLLNSEGKKRAFPPEILRGNPEAMEELIANCPSANAYLSGALSFSEPWDKVAPHLPPILASFEEFALPALCPTRAVWLWVAHKHDIQASSSGDELHQGCDIHFLAFQYDLSTGTRLQPYCQFSANDRDIFFAWRQWVNLRCGFVDPLERPPQDVRPARNLPSDKEAIRAAITRHLLTKINNGTVRNGPAVRSELESHGVGFVRYRKKGRRRLVSISVQPGTFHDQPHPVSLTLEGRIFQTNFEATYNPAGERLRIADAPFKRTKANEDQLLLDIKKCHEKRVDQEWHRMARKRRPRKPGRDPILTETTLPPAKIARLSPYDADNLLRTLPKPSIGPLIQYYELKHLQSIGTSLHEVDRGPIQEIGGRNQQAPLIGGVTPDVARQLSELINTVHPDCFRAEECASDILGGFDEATRRLVDATARTGDLLRGYAAAGVDSPLGPRRHAQGDGAHSGNRRRATDALRGSLRTFVEAVFRFGEVVRQKLKRKRGVPPGSSDELIEAIHAIVNGHEVSPFAQSWFAGDESNLEFSAWIRSWIAQLPPSEKNRLAAVVAAARKEMGYSREDGDRDRRLDP